MPKASDAPVSASPAAAPAAARSASPVFMDLDDAEEYLKALYFGKEGSGKTTAATFMANLPGEGVVIVINVEGGLKKAALKSLGVRTDLIKIWKPASGVVTYEELEKLAFQLSAQLAENPGSIKGVVLDSVTDITNTFLENAAKYWFQRDQERGKGQRDSAEVNEIQDYGLMTNQVRKLMRKFRDLPCHFAATALETEAAPDSGTVKQFAPEMSPKVRTSVLGYVDVALRLTSETVQTSADETETMVTARTKPSVMIRAKDRLNVFPRDLPEPRFDRLVEYADGATTRAEDEVYGLYEQVKEQAEAFKVKKAEERAKKA